MLKLNDHKMKAKKLKLMTMMMTHENPMTLSKKEETKAETLIGSYWIPEDIKDKKRMKLFKHIKFLDIFSLGLSMGGLFIMSIEVNYIYERYTHETNKYLLN